MKATNLMGGGATQNLTPANTPNNSKRFFTPIVASSLALFLSAGVANAGVAIQTCTNTGGNPSFCSASSGTSSPITTTDLNWANGSSTNVVIPVSYTHLRAHETS